MSVVLSAAASPRSRIRHLIALLVDRQRAAALETLRASLPLDDPDRHALDATDAAFARLAPHTDTTTGDNQ
jgi:hypothetical protein